MTHPYWQQCKLFFHWKRKRCWALLLLLIYTLVGFLGVPALLEKQLSKHISNIGYHLSIERIDFNPYTFNLKVQQVNLQDQSEKSLIAFEYFRVNLQLSSLWYWAWHFQEISLSNAIIDEQRLTNEQTRWLQFIQQATENNQSEPSVDSDKSIPRLLVDNLSINNLLLNYTDQTTAEIYQAEYGPINFSIQSLATLSEQQSEAQATIKVDKQAEINWTGDLQLAPSFSSKGKFQLQGKDFPQLRTYAHFFIPVNTQLKQAQFQFDYHIGMNADSELELLINNLVSQIEGLAVKIPDHSKPLVDVKTVSLQGGNIDLSNEKAELGELHIAGLQVDVERYQSGSLSFQSLLTEPAANQQAVSAEEPAASAWELSLARFQLTDSQIQFTDQQVTPNAHLKLENIASDIKSISNAANHRFPLALNFSVQGGGQLDFKADVGALPKPTVQGQLAIKALSFKWLEPYVTQFINVAIADSLLSLNSSINMDEQQNISATGQLAVNQLNIEDRLLSQQLLGWQRLAIDKFDFKNNTLQTSMIQLQKPKAQLNIRADKSSNISDLLVDSPADTATETEEQTSSPLAITIDGIDIQQAQLDFSDQSLPLPFAANIQNLQGNVSTLAIGSDRPVTVSLEGQVNQYGSAQINGELSPNDPAENSDVTMVFRNLEMYRLSPYSGKFAGRAIESGKLDLDLEYQLKQQQLEASNHIVMKQLTLGEKIASPDAANLPLELAISLLKDANGVIDINLPVSGDIQDPQFNIGQVITKAVTNLTTKLIASPFLLLAKLVGSDNEKFDRLEFVAGQSQLPPTQQEQLNKLAEALQQRPGLQLEIAGSYATENDSAALKQQKTESLIDEVLAKQQSASTAVKLRDQVIEELFSNTYPAADLVKVKQQCADQLGEDQTAYINHLQEAISQTQKVSAEELIALAKQRATVVHQYLLTYNQQLASRLSIGEPQQTSENNENKTIVPMKLTIKSL